MRQSAHVTITVLVRVLEGGCSYEVRLIEGDYGKDFSLLCACPMRHVPSRSSLHVEQFPVFLSHGSFHLSARNRRT
ncbi:hypothetical protein QQF64_024971 [Cirrhinus molitorella]|uniref:Uncharacterized protein n=1 Tax=Cirrhinus molitorella TaxID=172907 RepID=A0ABR3NMU0_9TELE